LNSGILERLTREGFCLLRVGEEETRRGWESLIALLFGRIHPTDFPQPGRGQVLDESGTTSDSGRPDSNFRHAFCRDAFSWSRHGNPGRMASWTLQTSTGGVEPNIILPCNNTLRSPNTEDQEILDDLFLSTDCAVLRSLSLLSRALLPVLRFLGPLFLIVVHSVHP
jgi:hypothetical protein